VRIATHLAETVLGPFVQGDREGFHAWMTKEAELLAEGAFGPQMLVEVGVVGLCGEAGWCGEGGREGLA
jgi:hypothetical protein